MLDYKRALELVLEKTPLPKIVESVSLSEATGRVLALNGIADVDSPPFDKSAMDGFAVCSADLAHTPTELRVVLDVPAGTQVSGSICSGEAASIMTGAPVPNGADSVVQVEWTSGFGAPKVTINNGVEEGLNISPKAEIVRRGDVLVEKGTRLGVEEIALLAVAGIDPVSAYKTPSVAVLSTGDEVVPASATPGPGQIRDVNGPAIGAFLHELGISPVFLGQVSDDKIAMRIAVERGLEYDCLFVSGGVSAGAYDFIEDVLAELEVDVHIRRVAVKPGKPTVFGTRGDKMVMGLPGNPVSAMVIARVFAEPILRRAMGLRGSSMKIVRARLIADVPKKPDRLWFVPGILSWRGDEPVVEPLFSKGSADLVTAGRANCLVVAPQGCSKVDVDAIVDVVVWGRAC